MRGAHLSADTSQVDRELDRLADLAPVTARLESLLTRQFQATQQAVHVDTGSLKHSGRITSDADAGVWRGELVYGGRSTGKPHDPVDYAVYDEHEDREHDFRAPAVVMGGEYRGIVAGHLRRSR